MFNSRCQHFKRVTLSTAQSPGSTCSSYQIADVATLSKTPHKRVKWLPIYSPPAQGLTHIQTWHAAHTLHMHAHALLVQQGANAVTPSKSMSTVPQDKGGSFQANRWALLPKQNAAIHCVSQGVTMCSHTS